MNCGHCKSRKAAYIYGDSCSAGTQNSAFFDPRDLVQVNHRSGERQRYCCTAACRRASKAASQASWLAKPLDHDYFSGPTHVARVQAWRDAHPGYSRGRVRPPRALQDLCLPQVPDLLEKVCRSCRVCGGARDPGVTRSLERRLAFAGVYVKPEVLCIDELGYLPIDKFGADCLFQIISHRYERGSTLLTTNRLYKRWAGIFNNDATLTSAPLDRLLHHVETVVIEGKSSGGQSHAEI